VTARARRQAKERIDRQPPVGPARPRIDVIALAVVLLALVLRLAVLWQLGGDRLLQPRGLLDDAVSMRLAQRVAAGDVALGPEVYYLSPLYTYFLGLVFALSGGSIAAARFVQVLLGAAAVALVMRTADGWFGRRAGIVAGWAAACTGLFAFNEILILQSALDPFLAALSGFTLSRALRRPAIWNSLAAGVSLGLLALNRPNALVLPAAVALTWVLLARTRAAFVRAAVLVAGTALALAPVVARNWTVAGEFALVSSQGGLNFYIGNHDRADGTWRPVPGVRPTIEGQRLDVRTVASAAMGHEVTASEASGYFYAKAWDWIGAHPGAWAALLTRKLALSLNSVDVALNYSFTYFAREQSGPLSALVVGPWLIIPLGLFGLGVWAFRGPAEFGAWAIMVPAYLATLVAFFVSSRYRLTLLVPLVVACGGGVTALGDLLAGGSKRRTASAIAALSLLFVAANWPMAADDGRLFQREERIAQLITDGRIDEGERLLESTKNLTPERTAALLERIGMVCDAQGEPGRAVTYFQRAVDLSPANRSMRGRLGEALLSAGQPAAAIPHLEAAVATPVAADANAYNLARAYAAAGRTEEARRTLASLTIGPDAGARLLTRLGVLAAGLGDRPLAQQWLTEAVRRDPSLAAARDALGVVLGQAGLRQEAIDAFQGAVALEPSNGSFRFHLAIAFAENGQFDRAREEAQAAARLRPGTPEIEALLRQLPPRR